MPQDNKLPNLYMNIYYNNDYASELVPPSIPNEQIVNQQVYTCQNSNTNMPVPNQVAENNERASEQNSNSAVGNDIIDITNEDSSDSESNSINNDQVEEGNQSVMDVVVLTGSSNMVLL